MAWSRQKPKKEGDAWSLGENKRKRRKLDSEVQGQSSIKDDWDDSMELTQAELETLDVIASQAIVEEGTDAKREETSTIREGAISETAVDMLFFAKPSAKVHGISRRSTSSSSGSSAHPASLSSRSASDASGSLSSHTSENGKVEVDTLQSLRMKLEEEVKKAQEEKYRSAGEMAFLRESLRRQEDELEKVRADRDAAMEKEKQTQQSNEKTLQLRLDSMTSEAQFKDREFKNLQEQFRSLQQKLKRLEQDKHQSPSGVLTDTSQTRMPSPQKVPVRPSPPSKQKLRQMEELGTHSKGFPTKQTFLEQAPTSLQGPSCKLSISTASCQTTETTVFYKKTRRLKLKILPTSDYESSVSGTGIVQHLLQTSLDGASHTENLDMGLIGLMHAMSTALNVAGLSYTRTGGTSSASLSPIKPKRLLSKKISKEETSGTLQVVSKEHFQLAVDGLSQLLDDRLCDTSKKYERRVNPGWEDCSSRYSEGSGGNKSFLARPGKLTPTKLCSGRQTRPPAFSSPNAVSSSAALILPLLTDYIQHYVDLLNHPPTKPGSGSGLMRSPHHTMSPYRSTLESTSHSATTSSSFESSLDSLNSSILQLLHDGHVYAASMENFACAALRCTSLLLLLCPAVGDFILVPQLQLKTSTSTFTSSTSGNSSAVEGDGKSEVEADDEKSMSSCEIRILAAAGEQASGSSPDIKPRIQSPLLFHLVLQLAAQDLKDSSCAPEVMVQALHVLTLLCQDCHNEHLPKLQSIVTRGILTNCLRQISHVSVLTGAVRLLQSISSQSALFCKLCTKSENCPLFLMHQVNANKNIPAKSDDIIVFYKEYISCVSSVIAMQQQGLQQLLSNSCPCSNELVSGIVLAMYKLFRFYQQDTKKKKNSSMECAGVLWALGQGVTLLHAVAQADSAFLQHHSPVQPQYVNLLSGLRAVFKTEAVGWEFHLSAVEELCDFDPDLSDLSQESETEDKMVQG
ncbi:ATR-interacting protein [Elysia marginata]|uniref:ATR-interacting protein n=1 Tax=Elysia marginata TaxID=1093978 RepID=A0AAV4FJU7_9GAST|nr:ATR-interacting protein [Elysia marginata]